MNNRGPMGGLPGIGQQLRQPTVDVSEAINKSCAHCDSEFFDVVFRLAVVPTIAPKNMTGKDVLVKFEAYLCRGCGCEYGKEVITKQ